MVKISDVSLLSAAVKGAQYALDQALEQFAAERAEHKVGDIIEAHRSASGKPCKAVVKEVSATPFGGGISINYACKALLKDGSEGSIDAYKFTVLKEDTVIWKGGDQ